ncbi:MAG: lysophospholipid acyltransferase family protein [Gemmatimonadales bacterium]
MSHVFEYAVARAIFAVLGSAPPALCEPVGGALGRLAYRVGWRRRVVESQISQAFPEKDEKWVRRTAIASFEHVGRESAAVAPIVRRGLDEVRRRLVVFEGREEMEAAVARGRGVVVASAHFGNWEFAGSTLAASGWPVDAVMQRLGNRHLNRYVEHMRGKLGMGLIDRVGAWDRLTESLAAGRVVAFVADQDARHRGVFVPFFGRPASTHKAPALLALRTGAPFFVGGVHRIGRQQYHAWLVRLDPVDGLGTREQIIDLTRRWLAEVELRVRLFPEQYFWHHRRWKTQPPGTA